MFRRNNLKEIFLVKANLGQFLGLTTVNFLILNYLMRNFDCLLRRLLSERARKQKSASGTNINAASFKELN